MHNVHKKYANRTCHECGIILPQPQMIRKEIMVETGKSNTTITGHTFIGAFFGDKPSVRALNRHGFNSGERTYTRKQTKWFCYECAHPGIYAPIKILSISSYIFKILVRLFKYAKNKI